MILLCKDKKKNNILQYHSLFFAYYPNTVIVWHIKTEAAQNCFFCAASVYVLWRYSNH